MVSNIERSPEGWQTNTSIEKSASENSNKSLEQSSEMNTREDSQNSVNDDSSSIDSDFKNSQNKGRGKSKRPSKGRVFQCTGYPDCNMSFTRSEHLARHKRKHTGEKPFTCPHCSKNFSRLDNLRQHKQTVHAYENYMINNSIKKDRQDVVPSKNPKTPSSAFFTLRNKEVKSPNSLISPPNSRSPRYHYSLQYGQQEYQPHTLEQSSEATHIIPVPVNSNPPLPAPPHHQSSLHQSNLLKAPTNQFKPKRRPQPLSLSHSFIYNNNSSIDSAYGGFLKSAPLMPVPSTTSSPSSFQSLHYPSLKSASLVPNLVSPLSPLFHQSFSQVNGAKTNVQHEKVNNNHETHTSANFSSNLNKSIKGGDHSLVPSKNMSNGSSQVNNATSSQNGALGKENSSDNKPIKEESTKSWLRGVLNEDNNTSYNDSSSGNNGEKAKPNGNTKQTFHSSKPSIDKLLSPYDNDKFPNSDKV